MRLTLPAAFHLQNTFHTLKDMRIVFVDGTVLDTADAVRQDGLSEKRCAPESDAQHAACRSIKLSCSEIRR